MGCDGGTIPRRDELVRTKKKPEQKDKKADLAFRWQHCALTQERLVKPIVACELGRLYNKESIIEMLLDRAKFEGAFNSSHIRNLKDVKELSLTDNPAYATADVKNGTHTAQYICPVSGLEMNGVYRFGYLRSCGCVFSERALKEMKMETCYNCTKACKATDVIILNGTEEEVEKLQQEMEQRRHLAKLEKKAKKGKESHTVKDDQGAKKRKLEASEEAGTSAAAQASKPGSKSKLMAATSAAGAARGEQDSKKPRSIQKDPTASATYKSLFTSCDAAKKQGKAHWVTHNPLYY